jgi:hypothetical protein
VNDSADRCQGQAGAPRADGRELLDVAESVAYRCPGPIGATLNMKKEGKELERSRKKWKEVEGIWAFSVRWAGRAVRHFRLSCAMTEP